MRMLLREKICKAFSQAQQESMETQKREIPHSTGLETHGVIIVVIAISYFSSYSNFYFQ